MRDRPKAAQPIPSVAKTVADVMTWEYPSVSIIVMVPPAAPVITRVTTVRLRIYQFISFVYVLVGKYSTLT